MKRLFFFLTALAVLSCSKPSSMNPIGQVSDDDEICAVKECWQITKASDDRAFAKDIPWVEGESVLLLGSDQSMIDCVVPISEGGYYIEYPTKKTICKVVKANGLKCTLAPNTPLEEGTYRAFYPVYDYTWYDNIHLCFLYESWKELDYAHQDIVVSDPAPFKEGHKLTFTLRHVCALMDIDIYPPQDGKYKYLKLFAANPVFAGKANYCFDNEYLIDEVASGWVNFATLRGPGHHMEENVLFPTSTGMLPVQYDGMPVNIHLVYEDGTHYVSDSFAMPSLNFGVENKVVVKNFSVTEKPMEGLWGDCYGDETPKPYTVR